jgi:hypothetical protein
MLLELLREIADESLLLFLVTLAVLLLAANEAGYRLGRRAFRRRTAEETARANLGFVVGGMLGVLAFLIAISLSLAESRHDERRDIVLAEANALGTAWLRAGQVGGEGGERLQRLLEDYTRLRIEAVRDIRTRADADRVNAETARFQAEMWEIATGIARGTPTSPVALMVASLNETFAAARSSRRAFSSGVPITVLRLLLWTAIITVGAMGYSFGAGGSRQTAMTLLMLVLWSSTMTLIIDVNRPRQGTVTVSPAPLEWTLEGFGTPAVRR